MRVFWLAMGTILFRSQSSGADTEVRAAGGRESGTGESRAVDPAWLPMGTILFRSQSSGADTEVRPPRRPGAGPFRRVFSVGNTLGFPIQVFWLPGGTSLFRSQPNGADTEVRSRQPGCVSREGLVVRAVFPLTRPSGTLSPKRGARDPSGAGALCGRLLRRIGPTQDAALRGVGRCFTLGRDKPGRLMATTDLRFMSDLTFTTDLPLIRTRPLRHRRITHRVSLV